LIWTKKGLMLKFEKKALALNLTVHYTLGWHVFAVSGLKGNLQCLGMGRRGEEMIETGGMMTREVISGMRRSIGTCFSHLQSLTRITVLLMVVRYIDVA